MWYLFLQAYCQKHIVNLKKKNYRKKKGKKEGREGSEGRNRGREKGM